MKNVSKTLTTCLHAGYLGLLGEALGLRMESLLWVPAIMMWGHSGSTALEYIPEPRSSPVPQEAGCSAGPHCGLHQAQRRHQQHKPDRVKAVLGLAAGGFLMAKVSKAVILHQ